MQPGRDAILERERRWAMPVAFATFAALGFLVASLVVASSLGGDGEAETLRDLYDHGSTVTLSSVLQGIGFALLIAPLVYLFRAASARSDRVRAQFLPLVVAAPLALSLAAVLDGVAANQAASDFVKGKSSASLSTEDAAKDCRSERSDDAAGFRDEFGKEDSAISNCAATKIQDDKAENAISDVSIGRVAEGIQFGGLLALAFALVYSCLHAMRVGLLTRFWGSLGAALGAVSFLFFQFALLWFIYLGILLLRRDSQPPAWASGEAIPWPSPGEKTATDLSAPDENEEPPPVEDQEEEKPVEKEQSQ